MAPDGDAGDGVSGQGDEGVYGTISDSLAGNTNAAADNASAASLADSAGRGGIGVDASDPFGPTSNIGGYGQYGSPSIGDVAGKVGSFIEEGAQNALNSLQNAANNPGRTAATVGLNAVIGAITGVLPRMVVNAVVDEATGRSIGGHIANAIFGDTLEDWSPPEGDTDAATLGYQGDMAFADAAGIGGLMNDSPFGDPSSQGSEGNDGSYYTLRDPSNMMAQQAVAASAAPPPSLFEPQQPQQQPWRPNMWSGNNFIMPRIG